MRWIKASNRLPGNDQYRHVKIDGIDRAGNFYQDGFEVKFYVAGDYEYEIYPDKFDGLEWLDYDAPSEMEEILWKELQDFFKINNIGNSTGCSWETYKQSLICKLNK